MTPGMSTDAFRRAALALPGAVENAHMNHPDFRVGNRIFATLGYPDGSWAMVKLPPEEQHRLVESMPETFKPAAGAWGGRDQRWCGWRRRDELRAGDGVASGAGQVGPKKSV
jgi:hypothetical protein